MNGNMDLNKQSWTKYDFGRIISLSVIVIALALGIIYNNQNKNINERASSDTKLFVSPASQDLHVSDTFTTQIGIDSGVNKVTGVDIVVNFDPKYVQINEVKATAELANFKTIIKNEINNSTGKIRYVAFTADKALAISGNLKILTLSGQVTSTSQIGTSEISIDSSSLISATGEGQNVLIESIAGTIKVSEKENVPNACGGTCGSNYNCQANLYCYQGYCRNPLCSDKSDCNCAAATNAPTTPPTKKPTIKPAPITTLKPTTVILATETPDSGKGGNFVESPTETLMPEFEITPEPTFVSEELQNQGLSSFAKYIIGMLFIFVIIIAVIIWKKVKKDSPHILPPTNI